MLNLTLTFQPLSMFKWQMYSAQTMKNKFNMLAGMMGEEEDDQVNLWSRQRHNNNYEYPFTGDLHPVKFSAAGYPLF